MAVARYPEELKAQARELRAAGMTLVQISLEIGVSVQTLSLWLRGMHSAKRGGGGRWPRPATEAEEQDRLARRARARALRAEGASLSEIASEVAISTSTASKWTRDVRQARKDPAADAPWNRADRDALRNRAASLRREGLSTAHIAQEIRVPASTVAGWLVGVQPPDWTRRPRAKDDLRLLARELRLSGLSYADIAAQIGVAKSSVSLWVRDLPVPDALRRPTEHASTMGRRYWERENKRRETERQEQKMQAASEIGILSERELLIAGVVLYWAEGAKDKPYSRREHLSFINSDVRVIQLYLRWLDLLGVAEDRRVYRLSIHESADVAAAHRYWAGVVSVPVERFRKPTLKRHQPSTVRLNTGPGYNGCLIIKVLGSRVEYQRMDGMFTAIAGSASAAANEGSLEPR